MFVINSLCYLIERGMLKDLQYMPYQSSRIKKCCKSTVHPFVFLSCVSFCIIELFIPIHDYFI